MDVTGIFGVVFSVGGPVLIVILALLWTHRRSVKRYEIAARAAESGRSMDEVREMLDVLSRQKTTSGKGWLRAGIITIAGGLGVLALALVSSEPDAMGGAAFIILLGIGFLTAWALADRQKIG